MDREQAAGEARAINRHFYEQLWSGSRLSAPERFNTWPIVATLLPHSPRRLEIGPGLRPRLPVCGTSFIDISETAVGRLNAAGGSARTGTVTALPFGNASFDLICAFDVIEHVEEDGRALAEISRVLKEDGVLICSVPLHARLWSGFDRFVGHVRRYEPDRLQDLLEGNGLVVERSAVFGMQPSNPRLLSLGVWFLTHRPAGALFWYNHLFLPLALLFQKPLKLTAGLVEMAGVDEIVLICRRKPRTLTP